MKTHYEMQLFEFLSSISTEEVASYKEAIEQMTNPNQTYSIVLPYCNVE